MTTIHPERGAEVSLTVNGEAHTAVVEARTTLADMVRDELDLTGTHVGCEHGVCGACTILVDGEPARACLMLAVSAQNAEVMTVEGLADGDALHPLQQAMRESHGFQCAFCAPGFLMTALWLLERDPEMTRTQLREELSGNLCRCTGYHSILEGVELAARRMVEVAGESTDA